MGREPAEEGPDMKAFEAEETYTGLRSSGEEAASSDIAHIDPFYPPG